MEENIGQISSNFKRKSFFKGFKPQSILPLVHINTTPNMKIHPKHSQQCIPQNNQDLSDFPALPTFEPSSSENENRNFNTSTLFSKVLTEKPNSNFSNAKMHVEVVGRSGKNKKPRGVQTVKLKKEPGIENSVKCEADSDKTVARNEHKPKLCQSNEQSQNRNVLNSREQIPVTTSLPDTTSSRDNNNNNNDGLPPDGSKTKRKHKKRTKRTSKLPQGKVNTISHAQYVAFMEPKTSKAADLSFNTSIEDENEYPALGLQFNDIHTKVKKENSACQRESSLSVMYEEVGENQELLSSTVAVSHKVDGSSPKPKKSPSDKKFNAPIEMNLMDMLSKMKKKSKKTTIIFQPLTVKREKVKSPNKYSTLNNLDSSGPSRKRGKEREVPKKPRLSKLKKVILKERVERRLRIALLSMEKSKEIGSKDDIVTTTCMQQLELEVQNLNLKTEPESEIEDVPVLTTVQPCDFQITTELEEESEEKQRLKCAKKLLHCRKFREYCNHFISEEMDTLTHNLLAELVRFQDRLFLKDPVKARARKRLVCGLKEVTKNLKLRKLKLIIIAPDIEEINSEGGLNDALQCIFSFCENFYTPVIFSLPRRKLGKVCKKKVPLSCVGIFNYEGTEFIYRHLMELVDEAKQVYKETLAFAEQSLTCEMIQSLSNDQVDYTIVEKMRAEFWESQSRC